MDGVNVILGDQADPTDNQCCATTLVQRMDNFTPPDIGFSKQTSDSINVLLNCVEKPLSQADELNKSASKDFNDTNDGDECLNDLLTQGLYR